LKKLFIIWTICLFYGFQTVVLKAQIDAFAVAKLDRNEVYPQQPIKATVTVYTATWFTKPLNIQNIQVPNAFVIPFKRTLSSMRTVDKKKYASLEFYYLIYPYKEGELSFPALNIEIESPPEGDYKGVQSTLRTKPLKFTVKEEPSRYEGDQWFVAKNFYISEQWDKPLGEIKVGDVVKRTIRLNAKGTLPNFIPDINMEALSFASVYKQSSEVTDTRNNQDANGIKLESFLYLFEEEGSFIIPEVRVDWWNPFASRAYFKTIPKKEIKVSPNPDLGMLATLQDSLNSINKVGLETSGKGEFFDTEMKEKLMIALTGVIALIVIGVIGLRLYRYRMEKIAEYHKTEKYAFWQLERASKSDAKQAMHAWWSSFYVSNQLSPSLDHELKSRGFSSSGQSPDLKTLKAFRAQVTKENKLNQHLSQMQFDLNKA